MTLKEALRRYIENLDGIQSTLGDSDKESLLSAVESLPEDGKSLSDEADTRHLKLTGQEKQDIQELRTNIQEWSKMRKAVKKMSEDIMARKKLIGYISREEMITLSLYLSRSSISYCLLSKTDRN